MNLLTPLAGFLIGYGGIMGYQVIDSTYKGEMPGPKAFGYFIGGMTLLSAATIYALGRTDKVFNAEGDSCQNCESPSTQTTTLVNKYGEEHEYKFCGDGCEWQYMRENKMSYYDEGTYGFQTYFDAQGLSQFTPEELTQSSAIHGDFDHASLNYSGHQNMILKAETMMPEKQCVICGGPYIGYGHNPEPIFPMSRGRCCDVCNATVVIPYRLGGMNFRFGEDFEAQGRDILGRFVKMDCDLCGGKDEVGYVDEEREFKVCEHCDVDGADYDPKLWEAQSARKSRYNLNRFTKSKRGNRTGTGVKRKVWQDLFSKSAEFESPRGTLAGELDVVLAQMYEIEDMENPTTEDKINYENLETRYYELVGVLEAENFEAQQQMRGRVRTMSGKPHVPRKLKKDKDISPEDAAKKVKFESPQNAYLLAYNQGFDDGRSQRRVSRTIFAPDKSYSEDEKLFEETFRRIK